MSPTDNLTVPIQNLGYIGVYSKDPQDWRFYGTEIMGAMVMEEGETVFVKIDDRSHRIAVHPGEEGGVAYLGFEVQGPLELEQAADVLRRDGVPFERIEGAGAEERKVAALLRLIDPNGVSVEIYYGQHRDYTFLSSKGVSRFVTQEQGLGHAVILTQDIDKTVDFYLRTFGFKISDIAQRDGNQMYFLRCGPREHTIAFIKPAAGTDVRLHHFMVEVGNIDDVGKAYDRIYENKIPLTLTLGRHANDSMISFYASTPGGFLMEYGCQGVPMTPTDAATTMTVGDIWGHRFVGDVEGPA
ncbi:VOC family protein [Aeromicrobium wangtongii]|uniref:VOC family protein n=1 Tax=Aeromicrobium wangtongii TaxID=2969247 RepID=UPI00201784C9|nr:VOC family protein [Aeromicrobium wangtongii]MCL3819406.1 VOC family protein [Aeromicrobium wangtongii]